MRRWLLTVLLLAVGGVMVLGLVHPASKSQPVKPSLLSDPGGRQAMAEAMKRIGYDGQAFMGSDWRTPSCDWHTYVVQPDTEDAPAFFFVKSLKTGETRFLQSSELDQALKRHVTYDGTFALLNRTGDNGRNYYSLGSMDRNGDRVFVYVHFDDAACGLKADEVWYWAPRVDEKVKLNLQLLP